jgi:fused signal recognition particle receptor
MGFFDKIKEKVSSVTSSVTNAVTSAVNTAVEKTSEALKFDKLKDGLTKTRDSFVDKIQLVLGVGRKIDTALLDEIEEILITADIGVYTTEKIIEAVKERVRKEKKDKGEEVFELIREEIKNILVTSPSAKNDAEYRIDEETKPHVIMVVGVNGVGKTTTIGKLAYNYKQAGKQVIIGAADTFRAAANEQLEIWAERAGVSIVQQKQGADPAAVAFDTLNSAIAKKTDCVIIDTAGRLHNKGNLMQELEKISRVMKKIRDTAPNEVYLVLDATTGQNAIMQAKEFMKVSPITGIVLTKLDGTAKGGVVIPIACELQIPVRYIGVGEKIDDLQVFIPEDFVDALFGKSGKEEASDNTN